MPPHNRNTVYATTSNSNYAIRKFRLREDDRYVNRKSLHNAKVTIQQNKFHICNKLYYYESNTIKGTLIASVRPSVRSSHFTSKECIWRSGTLVSKGNTLSDQMEGSRLYSQNLFLGAISISTVVCVSQVTSHHGF